MYIVHGTFNQFSARTENAKGGDNMTIYPTRLEAMKYKTSNDVVVKVEGGYTLMTIFDYCVWKQQK